MIVTDTQVFDADTGRVLLHQWWRTPSAKRADARWAALRAERIAKVRERFAARKADAEKELREWTEIPLGVAA
jgi:hypothetical protein